MKGKVLAGRFPSVQILLIAADRSERRISVLVDSGFTGYLTLPRAVIETLGFSRVDRSEARLADGSDVSLRRFDGTVEWDGREVDMRIVEAETNPAIGAALMQGYRLRVDWEENGLVSIEKLHYDGGSVTIEPLA